MPDADLRVGAMEQLPWPDDSFDVVTAINAVQFAADVGAAVAEAARVARGPRALLDGAGFGSVLEHADAATVSRTIAEAAAPFRRPDGSYRFENTFMYVVAT